MLDLTNAIDNFVYYFIDYCIPGWTLEMTTGFNCE